MHLFFSYTFICRPNPCLLKSTSVQRGSFLETASPCHDKHGESEVRVPVAQTYTYQNSFSFVSSHKTIYFIIKIPNMYLKCTELSLFLRLFSTARIWTMRTDVSMGLISAYCMMPSNLWPILPKRISLYRSKARHSSPPNFYYDWGGPLPVRENTSSSINLFY